MSNLKNLLIKIAAPAIVALPALSAFAIATPTLDPKENIGTVPELRTSISSWAVTIAASLAIIAVVMIIYAGFLYVTAGTNEKNTEKAKGIITYAIIGLVVAALAWTITEVAVSFIGGSSGGSVPAPTPPSRGSVPAPTPPSQGIAI